MINTKKQRWVDHYARLILQSWTVWVTPLGIASDYIVQIREDLSGCYDNPIRRSFIENSY